MSTLCRLLGVTRQAYYQHQWHAEFISIEEDLVLAKIQDIRKNHARMGGRKLYEKLEPFFLEHKIKMGRDALFDLLRYHGLLVQRKKKRIVTTHSSHWLRKYPNLIQGWNPEKSNQLWVSDITYWKIETGHVYLSLITDAFSHKVVGYHVANSLEAVETVKALNMAIQNNKEKIESLIHHSDRGVQYCSSEYIKQLQKHKIKISMTQNGDPYENAIAERINGILKQEYLEVIPVFSLQQAKDRLDFVIPLYNKDRPHMSIGNKTPEEVHEKNIKTKKLWKLKKFQKDKEEALL